MDLNGYEHEEESIGAQRSNLLLNEEEDVALHILITSTAVFMLHIQPFKISPPVLHNQIRQRTPSKNTIT